MYLTSSSNYGMFASPKAPLKQFEPEVRPTHFGAGEAEQLLRRSHSHHRQILNTRREVNNENRSPGPHAFVWHKDDGYGFPVRTSGFLLGKVQGIKGMPDQQVSGSNKTNQLFSLLSKHAGGSKKLLSMGKEKPLAAPQGLVSMPTAVLPEQSTVATASSTTMPKEANTAEKQVSVPEKSPFSMPVIDQDSATEQVSRRGKLTRSASKNSMNNLEEVNQFNQRNLLSSAPTPDAPVHVYAWSSKQEKGIPFKVEGDPAKKARRFMQASLEDKAKALRVFKVLTDYTKGISNLFAMNKGDVIERDTQLPTQVNTAGRASEIQDAATWILPASRGGRGGIRGRGRGGFRGRGRGRGGMQGGL